MVLPYLFIVSGLKYVVLKPHFADKNRPVISPWHENFGFAVHQVISGTGRSDDHNPHSTGKAHCRNWNILGECGKTLDSASLWRVKNMMPPGFWRFVSPDTSRKAVHFIRAMCHEFWSPSNSLIAPQPFLVSGRRRRYIYVTFKSSNFFEELKI